MATKKEMLAEIAILNSRLNNTIFGAYENIERINELRQRIENYFDSSTKMCPNCRKPLSEVQASPNQYACPCGTIIDVRNTHRPVLIKQVQYMLNGYTKAVDLNEIEKDTGTVFTETEALWVKNMIRRHNQRLINIIMNKAGY